MHCNMSIPMNTVCTNHLSRKTISGHWMDLTRLEYGITFITGLRHVTKEVQQILPEVGLAQDKYPFPIHNLHLWKYTGYNKGWSSLQRMKNTALYILQEMDIFMPAASISNSIFTVYQFNNFITIVLYGKMCHHYYSPKMALMYFPLGHPNVVY